MRKADLSTVRRKVARAKDKLDTLSAEAAAYLDAMPYRIVVEANGDDQTIVCRVDRAPDPEWALELSEIAYQARSALDQLVKQLVIDSGNVHQRGTAFPIFRERDPYVKPDKNGIIKRDKLLKGVASRHRRVIDDVQPYQRGRWAANDPLAVLSTVSNRDKHDESYTAIAAVGRPRFKIVRRGLEDITVEFTAAKYRPYPMGDGDELISVNTADLASHEHLHLEVLEMNVELGFVGDRVVTLPQIDEAVLRASAIIERCASRLKP